MRLRVDSVGDVDWPIDGFVASHIDPGIQESSSRLGPMMTF
jgi:hypothetical protein